ncbi:MAG: glutamine synthetase type III, partial [Chloroflexota bacterium]
FAGVNGSGKHVNISLGNSTQGNLLEPTDEPHSNKQFLVFCASFIRAVSMHGDMIRGAIATASNDHRLGANEAPPAIISMFLGDQLNDVFDQIKNSGKATSSTPTGSMHIGTQTLPGMLIHAGDRNRTSPFAFTGNKFELRAVGSSQSIAGPIMVVNTILAESLDYAASKLEGAKDVDAAVDAYLAEVMKEHHNIIFNGDNYSEDWHKEAEERGLPNLRTTPDALPALVSEKAVALFSKYGVLNETEAHAAYEVALEQYNMSVNVEANLVVEMAKTMIMPAAIRYQAELASAAAAVASVGLEADTELLQEVTGKIAELKGAIAGVEAAHGEEMDDPLAEGVHNKDNVLPAMLTVRAVVDALEGIVPDDLWPLPTYQEMLFIR